MWLFNLWYTLTDWMVAHPDKVAVFVQILSWVFTLAIVYGLVKILFASKRIIANGDRGYIAKLFYYCFFVVSLYFCFNLVQQVFMMYCSLLK